MTSISDYFTTSTKRNRDSLSSSSSTESVTPARKVHVKALSTMAEVSSHCDTITSDDPTCSVKLLYDKVCEMCNKQDRMEAKLDELVNCTS